ncbi:hypothetical protein ACLOJK_037481 [Asimina triloba]
MFWMDFGGFEKLGADLDDRFKVVSQPDGPLRIDLSLSFVALKEALTGLGIDSSACGRRASGGPLVSLSDAFFVPGCPVAGVGALAGDHDACREELVRLLADAHESGGRDRALPPVTKPSLEQGNFLFSASNCARGKWNGPPFPIARPSGPLDNHFRYEGWVVPEGACRLFSPGTLTLDEGRELEGGVKMSRGYASCCLRNHIGGETMRQATVRELQPPAGGTDDTSN